MALIPERGVLCVGDLNRKSNSDQVRYARRTGVLQFVQPTVRWRAHDVTLYARACVCAFA